MVSIKPLVFCVLWCALSLIFLGFYQRSFEKALTRRLIDSLNVKPVGAAPLSGCETDSPNPLKARFVLFKLDRSGSSWLTELLQSHPSISIIPEVLNNHYERPYSEQLAYINEVLECTAEESVCGFTIDVNKRREESIFSSEAAIKVFILLLQRYATKVLVLERRNVVRQVLSFATVKTMQELSPACKNRWNLGEGTFENRSDPCWHEPKAQYIDVSQFIDAVRFNAKDKHKNMAAITERLGLPRFQFYYEDLQRDYQSILKMILAFLELPLTDISILNASHTKHNPSDTRKIISNWPELHEALKQTCFGPQLEADFCSSIEQQYCSD